MLKPRTPRPATAKLAATPTALPNDGEMTVSALAGALKRTVEDRFGYVRVRGEVSNFRGVHSSGHAYFSLKDVGARLDAVIWKTSFAKLRVKPEEGMDVIASGRITTFPGKSSYQIVIDQIEPAGIGALMAILEDRRRRLLAEGLFEAARKRALPFLPAVIGVVTSPTGAVIRDILHRIADRFGTRVLVWPVRVQGETSADEVTRALLGFNAPDLLHFPRPDVLIVARGGGSLEDLWGFNDEALVRAAAASGIPLISAIGHETDWTLLDHVADLRAPTPTGAAELAVPVKLDLALRIDRLEGRQTAAVLRLLDDRRLALRAAARLLPSGGELVAIPRQRLDHAGARLPGALAALLSIRRLQAERLGGRLVAQAPRARLARLRQQLDGLGPRLVRASARGGEDRALRLKITADRLAAAFAARLRLGQAAVRTRRQHLDQLVRRLDHAGRSDRERRTARLAALAQLLAGMSYRSVLARGFALVRDAGDHAVRQAAGVSPGAALSLEFADGRLAVTAGEGEARPRVARPRASPARPGGQGTLF